MNDLLSVLRDRVVEASKAVVSVRFGCPQQGRRIELLRLALADLAVAEITDSALAKAVAAAPVSLCDRDELDSHPEASGFLPELASHDRGR